MPKYNLTNRFVESIKPKASGQSFYWDSQLRRFGLRVGAIKKTFICEKKINGNTSRITVGHYPDISVIDARAKASEIFLQLSDGVSINQKKMDERNRTITLDAVYIEYIASRPLKPNTLLHYSSAMRLGYPDWGNNEIRAITKDMVEDRHLLITEERGPAQANKFTRVLRLLFNFAIAKYEVNGVPVITVNPVVRISDIRCWNKIFRKTGHLKAHHLKEWFAHVERIDNTAIRDYLKFILYTGTRRSEAACLKWADVSLDTASLVVKDPKNGIDMELPISNELMVILARRNYLKKTEWVFPSPSSKSGHIEETRKAYESIGKSIGHHFTIHDLRRTFVTFAEGLDISHYSLKALVNHKMSNSDVTSSYVQLSVERLREPMQRISTFITENIK